jgi:hypothetical protein
MLTIETSEGIQIEWSDDRSVKKLLSYYDPESLVMIFDESGKLLDCLSINDLFNKL